MATRVRWMALALLAGCALPAMAGGDPEAGKQKAQVCFACHGEDGNANTEQVPTPPRLAGQHADYLATALKQYASGERKNALMAGFAANLTPEDRADISAYFASQGGGLRVIDWVD